MIFDAHYDLGPLLQEAHIKGNKDYFKSIVVNNWIEHEVKLVIAAVFLEDEQIERGALEQGLEQVALIKSAVTDHNQCILIRDKKDLEYVMASDKVGVMISLEGLEPVGDNIMMLDVFYNLGVRAAGLTWSRENAVADGSRFGIPSSDKGISDYGQKVIDRMRELGMIIDVSHLNDAGVNDLKGTIIASHSNARTVRDIKRNISDEQILKIAESGGIIGINNVKPIISKEPSIEALCDHVDHIKSLVGSKYVCFGFDLCDELDIDFDLITSDEIKSIDMLKGYGDVNLIINVLKRRGYSEEEVTGICYRNLLDFLREKLA